MMISGLISTSGYAISREVYAKHEVELGGIESLISKIQPFGWT